MCCAPCFGGGCLSSLCCSECVGKAACNPTLCSGCLTGTQCTEVIPCVTDIAAGQDVPLCACKNSCNPHCLPCSPASHGASDVPPADVSACLPYAGTDANGNEIYQKSDGSYVYSDGSAATKTDIICSQGACNPALSEKNVNSGGGAAGSSGAGSGGGKSGGGGTGTSRPPKNAAHTQTGKQLSLGSRLGSVFSGLFSGGKTVPAHTILPGQKIPSRNGVTPISSNTMLLIIVIIGILLLMMAFGGENE